MLVQFVDKLLDAIFKIVLFVLFCFVVQLFFGHEKPSYQQSGQEAAKPSDGSLGANSKLECASSEDQARNICAQIASLYGDPNIASQGDVDHGDGNSTKTADKIELSTFGDDVATFKELTSKSSPVAIALVHRDLVRTREADGNIVALPFFIENCTANPRVIGMAASFGHLGAASIWPICYQIDLVYNAEKANANLGFKAFVDKLKADPALLKK
jgi:hypothetical protein